MVGYCTHAADMVLVINLFVTKNKFMETNFTTSKDAKISCKGQLKAVSVILCFIATIAMSCCFKQIWQDSNLSSFSFEYHLLQRQKWFEPLKYIHVHFHPWHPVTNTLHTIDVWFIVCGDTCMCACYKLSYSNSFCCLRSLPSLYLI